MPTASATSATAAANPASFSAGTNPVFDPRINSIGAYQDGKQLRQRGSIRQALPRGGTRYGVHFLRNPSAVSLTHGLDDTLNTDPNAHDLNDVTSVLPVTTQSSISFSLLFDRTFETLDPAYKGQSVHSQGVYTDMAAFYRMLGMLQPTTVVGEGDKGSENYAQKLNVDKGAAPGADDPAKPPTLTAPMQYVSCNLYLGGPLTYFGIINGFNISITQWTVNMVPVRAAIDVGFTILPVSTLEAVDKAEDESNTQRNFYQPYVRPTAQTGGGGFSGGTFDTPGSPPRGLPGPGYFYTGIGKPK